MSSKRSLTKQKKISGKNARYLRGLGHHISPLIIIGKDGVTKALINSANDVLQARELVKVKLLQTCPLDRREASELLAQKTGSFVAQILGKTFLLFRENPERKDEGKILFP